MDYYFAKNFDWNRLPYFNKVKIQENTAEDLRTRVLSYFDVNTCPTSLKDYYNWIEGRTLKMINPQYQQGVFYHYYVNQYLYELESFFWLIAYDSTKNHNTNEKECNKKADAAKKSFVDWCKGNFK